MKPTEESFTADVLDRLRSNAETVVSRFLEQMPAAYFSDTDPATQLSHVCAILGARAAGVPLRLTQSSEDGTTHTVLQENSYPGKLAELMRQLPEDQVLHSAQVHTARDGSLVVNVFRTAANGSRERLSPYRREKHLGYLERLRGQDDVEVDLEADHEPGRHRIAIATATQGPRTLFQRVVEQFGRHRLNIARAHLDMYDASPSDEPVCIINIVVEDTEKLGPDTPTWHQLQEELIRIKWIDAQAFEMCEDPRGRDLLRAESLLALCHLAHAGLVHIDSFAFSRERLYALSKRHRLLADAIVDLFLDRFDFRAPLTDSSFEDRCRDIEATLQSELDDKYALGFFEQLLRSVKCSLRCNVHCIGRHALAIRFDPALLASETRAETPFGAFFVNGDDFDAFHVRFRAVARGGVRIVRPIGAEQHSIESERLYAETYGLAFAQQLKNKDIPEGGSKAVVLTRPGRSVNAAFRAFCDGLLDLLAPCKPPLVDLVGEEELLYLGPDENVSPGLIEWVVERARGRGYAMPEAFMSSKPEAGINHKEFGVTSEGVTIFLEAALKAVGIDPRSQPFTIKITGGPDGDVAGNQLRILRREFGEHPRVVCISDGSGFATDPEGLDFDELLRLVDAQLPIANFDRDRLGARGELVAIDEPGAVKRRNTVHNQVIADAFVPAGGRPETIHRYNWQAYLRDGTPSSRVIVEGANLFITPAARRALAQEAGVVIVKDSSANKCGVIASSYEIAASMLLTPEEFVAVKTRFVSEVLELLRALARQEAQLLFRERRRRPDLTLPELSIEVSRTIIRAADAIERALPTLETSERVLVDELVREHLPAVLVERAADRIATQMPASYRASIISARLASRIVYREGLEFLQRFDDDALACVTLGYLRQEQEVERLVTAVQRSSLPDRERIVELLERAGVRVGIDLTRGCGSEIQAALRVQAGAETRR